MKKRTIGLIIFFTAILAIAGITAAVWHSYEPPQIVGEQITSEGDIKDVSRKWQDRGGV